MNKIAIDLVVSDTFFGHPLGHEFKDEVDVKAITWSKNVGLVNAHLNVNEGVANIGANVLGASIWSASYSEVGTHTVDVTIGTGSIKGTITVS